MTTETDEVHLLSTNSSSDEDDTVENTTIETANSTLSTPATQQVPSPLVANTAVGPTTNTAVGSSPLAANTAVGPTTTCNTAFGPSPSATDTAVSQQAIGPSPYAHYPAVAYSGPYNVPVMYTPSGPYNMAAASSTQQFGLAPKRPHNFLFIVLYACICCFFPTGIVALVYSCQVNDQYNAGDYAEAERSSDSAYRFTKISIMVGILIAVAIPIATALFLVISLAALAIL